MHPILKAIHESRREFALEFVEEFVHAIPTPEGTKRVRTGMGMTRLEHYFTTTLNAMLANSAITGPCPQPKAIVTYALSITIEAINTLPGE